MVTKSNEIPVVLKPALFGGVGDPSFANLGSIEQLCGIGRVFSHIRLKPGDSIGIHKHENEFEFYYVLSGSGLYNDNGTEIVITTNDVTYCPDGEIHGIVNNTNEVLEMIAFVGFPKK